jgi:hypothetical protein
MEVEVSEDALGAGAAALSAALTEAMKEGHAKSVALQQQKLTCVMLWFGLVWGCLCCFFVLCFFFCVCM